jgi:hypothetical protein
VPDTAQVDRPESVKLDAATIRLVRTIAAATGRGNAEVIRRCVLMYCEGFFDGTQAGMRAAADHQRRPA